MRMGYSLSPFYGVMMKWLGTDLLDVPSSIAKSSKRVRASPPEVALGKLTHSSVRSSSFVASAPTNISWEFGPALTMLHSCIFKEHFIKHRYILH